MFRHAFVTLFIISVAQATEFYECDVGPAATNVEIEGCDMLPCQVVRGKDISAVMTFKTGISASKLEPLVRVKAFGFWVTYPLDIADACSHLIAGKCPMSPGDEASFSFSIPVLPSYPKISITVEVSLLNEDQTTVSCFNVDGQVID